MNLIEIIEVTGSLPIKAEINDGTKLELFIRRKSGNKGYIASLWVMVHGIQHRMFEHGTGATPDKAKEDLKQKIINPF